MALPGVFLEVMRRAGQTINSLDIVDHRLEDWSCLTQKFINPRSVIEPLYLSQQKSRTLLINWALNRYGFSDPQWLQRAPQGFRLVETWPPDLLLDHVSLFRPRNIALLFDNGEDAFAVRSSFALKAIINISLHSTGNLLWEDYKKEYTRAEILTLAGSKSDRVSFKLSSGRLVYVSSATTDWA